MDAMDDPDAPLRAAPDPDLARQDPRREALRGHAAMLLFAATISISFIIGRRTAGVISPEAITLARFVVGALALSLVALPRARLNHAAAPWRHVLIGGLYAGYFILMFEALGLTGSVPIAALYTTVPLLSAFFGWLTLGQVTGARMALALGLGAAGALWVVFRGDPAALMAFDLGRGEALFVLGCVLHGLAIPLLRRLNRGEPAAVLSCGALLGGAAVTLLWAAPALPQTAWGALPAWVWGAILYLGLFATAGTFLMMRYAAQRLPAGKVMAYGYLVPVFVIAIEGLMTGIWVALPVWLGVVAVTAALLILLMEDDAPQQGRYSP